MKQKSKASVVSLIIMILLIVFITAIILFNYFNDKTVMNTWNVSGNTAGNLYNNGLFCEYKDSVYFSNPYDKGYLYVMNSDGTDIRKLYNDTVSYINAAGKYIYYARNNLNDDTIGSVFRGALFGVHRINMDGKKNVTLNDEPTGIVSLAGNKIFYQHYDSETALTLRSVTIDGKTEHNIDQSAIAPACVDDGTIYYNNVKDNFNLCAMDAETESTSLIYEGKCWMPVKDGNYIYFMDLEDNYSLARIDLSTLEKESLGTGRIETYNIAGDYIYYQLNDPNAPALYRMTKDGGDAVSIIEGNFCNINATSNYIYFNQYGYDAPIYKIPVAGPIEITRFDEAQEAVGK